MEFFWSGTFLQSNSIILNELLEYSLSLKNCMRYIYIFLRIPVSHMSISKFQDITCHEVWQLSFKPGIWNYTGASKWSQFLSYIFTKNQFLVSFSWLKYIFIVYYEKLNDFLLLNYWGYYKISQLKSTMHRTFSFFSIWLVICFPMTIGAKFEL